MNLSDDRARAPRKRASRKARSLWTTSLRSLPLVLLGLVALGACNGILDNEEGKLTGAEGGSGDSVGSGGSPEEAGRVGATGGTGAQVGHGGAENPTTGSGGAGEEEGSAGAGGDSSEPDPEPEPEPEKPVICTPDEARCTPDGDIEICSEDGTAYLEERIPCKDNETCLNGECRPQQCEPDSTFCLQNEVHVCSSDGLTSEVVESCEEGWYCDTESTSCKEGVCAPSQPACDGNRATQCNGDGSGFESEGTDCPEDTTCQDGQCVPHVCPPDTTYCLGSNVVSCASNGLTITVVEICSADQYCDDRDPPACVDTICEPQSQVCTPERDGFRLCNAIGSGFITVKCEHGCNPSSDRGVCYPVCAPGSKRCEGNTLRTCNAEGTGYTSQSCEHGCNAASPPACFPTCAPGTHRCLGKSRQICTASGTAWIDLETCGTNRDCQVASGGTGSLCVVRSCTGTGEGKCEGWTGGGNPGWHCCEGTCQQKKKDWAGVYYCPHECAGGPFQPGGTC